MKIIPKTNRHDGIEIVKIVKIAPLQTRVPLD